MASQRVGCHATAVNVPRMYDMLAMGPFQPIVPVPHGA
jgi:hypothetical protein